MSLSAFPFSSLFDALDEWQVVASGQAEGRLTSSADDAGRPALRLDYDFHDGGGFVVIRRMMDFTLPETFEIGFRLRGWGLPNNIEFKVADPGGANVWRFVHPDFPLPEAWSSISFHERDLPFAWGPAGGGAPSAIGAVEWVIAAGPGGKGALELAGPSLDDQSLRAPRAIHASSARQGFPADAVFAAHFLTEWRADRNDSNPWWAVDFGRPLRFGGLVIDWPEPLPPRAILVEISNDGATWSRVFHASRAMGTRTHIPAPAAEARHLRITFGNAACAALRALTLRPDAFSRTPNEFIHAVAADFPRGWFPRYWYREQSYWTPVGSPLGKRRALINEEGMVEVDEAGFSLEPFVWIDDQLVTWADVATTCVLPKGRVPNTVRSGVEIAEERGAAGSMPAPPWPGHAARSLQSPFVISNRTVLGGAPLPSVRWQNQAMCLDILPWVSGNDAHLTLHVTYRLKCRLPAAGTRLIVTARPYQVIPPWQAFRNLGGRSPVYQIRCGDHGLRVGDRNVAVTPQPDMRGAAAFEEGGVPAFLSNGAMPPHDRVDDESGLASAAMAWDMPLDATTLEVTVSVPWFEFANKPAPRGRATALARWRRTLGAVRWDVPACAVPAFEVFRTAAAHILINRDGPAIQPGPRRYTRSWIRDCVIMGAALAKAGLPAPLREFLTWYATFQRADGFVPSVVDRDGIDWLVEHDSHGQFLWGIREVFRGSGDRRFLTNLYPHARLAADFLIELRAQRMTAEYQSGARAACCGLLPESVSHEGYLAHPVHSYWDDFWGVRGLEAAADLAAALDLTDDANRWQREAANFQQDLLRSIDSVIRSHHLAYVPGSVEWADFDPTATANAIALLDFAGVLPRAPLDAMLATYLDGFHRKHRGEIPWLNYTAYEIRIIGAFTRLGKRAEANELLEFFLSDRRPPAWNQWPEITWRDPRAPGHLGDVPHTWIAAEYLLALASMVADEREASGSMVLAAGMPWAWISEDHGFTVNGLPTRYGRLDFNIAARGRHAIRVAVGGTLILPPGGLTIAPPLPAGMRITGAAGSNGNACAIDASGASVTVHALPFQATLRLT